MIAVRPDPNGDAIRLTNAKNISLKLARDIASGVGLYMENPSRWKWSPATVRTALSNLMPVIGDVVRNLPLALKDSVCENGLDAFDNEHAWAQMIGTIHRSIERKTRRGQTISTLHKLISFHRHTPDASPPCRLLLRSGHSDISELYRVSPEFLLDYKRLIQTYDEVGNVETSGMWLKHQTYSQLSLIIDDPHARNWLATEGFDAFSTHPRLLEMAEQHRTWQQVSSLVSLLSLHDPGRWKRKTVEVLGHAADLTELWMLSEHIFLDIERFATEINKRKPTELLPTTVRDLLTKIQRDLPRILALLPAVSQQDIKQRGFIAFTENGSQLLLLAVQSPDVDLRMVTPIKEVIDALFPHAKRNLKEMLPFQLAFENEYSARPTFCDYGLIRDISLALYDDLVRLLAEVKASLAGKPFNMVTVYHHYIQLKAVMVLFREEIEYNSSHDLRLMGMNAFNLPGGKLQKTIFSLLQSAARTGVVTTRTAYTYKTSVVWFLDQFGFGIIDAYPITVSRTEKHLKRLNTDDFYSAEQCRELAYHIESLLAGEAVVGEHRIALILARILLKTGWNLTPTLGIESGDIIRTSTPLNPNGTVAVVLRKARASYQSDAYTFEAPETNVIAMRSAVVDLMHVQDELTAGLRASLPDGHPYKSYIFLIERRGAVQRLSMAATKAVTEMLAKRGCSLTFDSKKIRKGGVNHLYRQVQKDLYDYESAAKHDFKTFEASYLRIDENQSRYTLGKAVDIMGKYFTRKEIAPEIVIVTDQTLLLQHTPTGECASVGNDAEAKRYGVEHKQLHAERGIATTFCADFLSCIWCKFFRLVADAEHVWKLLSYRDYVLLSMESTALEGDATDDQQTHIDILKARITEMLGRLDALMPGVVKKGEALLAKNGMHPDWSYALVDAPVHTSGKS